MRAGVLVLALLACPVGVAAADVTECGGRIGVDLLYPPYERHIKTFANGAISVFNTDTNGEPVSCSRGIAITFPDTNEPGTHCFYIGCYASVSDAADATATYDAAHGLLIEMKTGAYTENGPAAPSKGLKLRVNQKLGKVSIER